MPKLRGDFTVGAVEPAPPKRDVEEPEVGAGPVVPNAKVGLAWFAPEVAVEPNIPPPEVLVVPLAGEPPGVPPPNREPVGLLLLSPEVFPKRPAPPPPPKLNFGGLDIAKKLRLYGSLMSALDRNRSRGKGKASRYLYPATSYVRCMGLNTMCEQAR